ncbi:hypothetical protein D3C71_1332960 [compost metagenome]
MGEPVNEQHLRIPFKQDFYREILLLDAILPPMNTRHTLQVLKLLDGFRPLHCRYGTVYDINALLFQLPSLLKHMIRFARSAD